MRKHDPDRFLAALFAPAGPRRHLFALYALNHELAHIAESVRQPMLGEIRLQWWRETIEQAREGRPRDHDVARALAALFGETDLPQAPFEAMLEARVFDSAPDRFDTVEALEDYADATAGNLMRLAATLLDGAAHDALAREAGIAYALTGIVRAIPFHAARGKAFLPPELLTRDVLTQHARLHLAAARREEKPGRAIAAFLPASCVPVYVKAVLRDRAEVPLYRRQLAMLGATFRGTV